MHRRRFLAITGYTAGLFKRELFIHGSTGFGGKKGMIEGFFCLIVVRCAAGGKH